MGQPCRRNTFARWSAGPVLLHGLAHLMSLIRSFIVPASTVIPTVFGTVNWMISGLVLFIGLRVGQRIESRASILPERIAPAQ